jgi:hypothetical protein
MHDLRRSQAIATCRHSTPRSRSSHLLHRITALAPGRNHWTMVLRALERVQQTDTKVPVRDSVAWRILAARWLSADSIRAKAG